MDSSSKVMIVGVMATTVVLVARTIASSILRYRELERRDAGVDEGVIRDRLERIELAVDTIAIEVERLGEHHRFNAQLALNKPAPAPPKVITPH